MHVAEDFDEFYNEIESIFSEVKISLIDFDLQDERLITEAAKESSTKLTKSMLLSIMQGWRKGDYSR